MNNAPRNTNNRPASEGGAPRQAQNRQLNRAPQQQQRPAAQRPAGAQQAQQRPTGTQRPAGAQRPAVNAQRRPQSTGGKAPQGGGKKFKLGKDGILALIMLLLIITLVVIIIVCTAKAIIEAVNKTSATTGTTQTTVDTSGGTTAPKDPVYTTPVVGAWNEGYITLEKSNSAVNEGNLILVNNNHKTVESSNLVDMYKNTGYGSVYVLKTSDLKLNATIVSQLISMLTDMKESNSATLSSGDRILISSGFRTVTHQQELYDAAVAQGKSTVAKPEHSEHHTGLTFDIKIFTAANATIDLRTSEQQWLEANCAKYGFILRYPADKIDITQIDEESWHFRYVGVAHATYMTENNLCLEEYISLLRDKYAYGVNAPLNVTAEGKDYTIYYFPASVEHDVTNIYVPATGQKEISGNNVDGFIVTVMNESK